MSTEQSTATPNHALQRTGSAVTAPATDHRHLSAHRQVPRSLRLSLSLGSLGRNVRPYLMRKLRAIGIVALLIVLFVAWQVISRPPSWRDILYEGMFDACRDESISRARLWMFLGASPDGASDYDAGRGHNGFEFSSHVHTVVDDEDTRLLRFLLERGASPDLALGDGTTPLVMAIHDHKVEALKILLDAGANPRYSDRWTAVDQAKSLKFHDLIPVIEPYLKKSQAQSGPRD